MLKLKEICQQRQIGTRLSHFTANFVGEGNFG